MIVTNGLLPVIETTALKDVVRAKAGLIFNSEVAGFQVNPLGKVSRELVVV